ncbi:MAG TPA: DUF305 domain-containing protein [Longimicrobiales bacterium]|nr:DUF305 domain-containing protein [Longimicrobiales bacterium]
MTRSELRLIAALLAPIVLPACSQATASPAATAPAPTAADEEFEAIFRARMDSARTRYTDADVHFMTGMIHHHAQAIEVSRMVPGRGASQPVQTLAARIINAQQDEIATMQRWLRNRDQPVPELHITDTGVMVHGADHAMHMPGMLTPEQIRQLDAARGAEFDRLFLTFMIQHHRGAVTMVRELFAMDGAGQDEEVFKFASDAQVDQATEVARMELMLSEMSSGDRSQKP